MEFQVDSDIPFPRVDVWQAYRDKLPELVAYLPNVRGIEVKERFDDEDAGIVKLVNIWRGGGDIPAVARAVISEKMLSWTDRATWDVGRWLCEWKVETHFLSDAVQSSGTNRYIETDQGTRLEIRGRLDVDAKKVPGVPRLLAGRVSKAVEEFVVKQIRGNLVDVSRGVGRYLEDNG